jgi:hypothetical protein
MDIGQYISSLNEKVNSRNGYLFASEIAILQNIELNQTRYAQVLESFRKVNYANICSAKFNDSQISSLVASRIDATVAILADDYPRGKPLILFMFLSGYNTSTSFSC